MLSRVAVLSSVVAVAFSANLHDRAYYEAKFIDWMTQHSIKPSTGSHFVQMLQNFANNDDIIETHNSKKLSYTLGHNKFSHMSNEEFKAFVQLNPMKPKAPSAEVHAAGDKSLLASSIDWVAKGAVTGVKDQGQCGSCWSFSTTGSLEGAYFNAQGSLVSFSEQNLVDCDNFRNGGSDMGCNGGWMDNAFEWVNKNGGLCTESGYPYVSGTTKSAGDCKTSCAKNTKVQTKAGAQGYTDVKVNDVDALKSALNKQTVSVAIQADQAAFQLYKSGVFTADCGADLDHGVLATGYGTSGGEEYWAVKNSWGTSWGQDGYIWLAIDVKAAEGQCGILSAASYANLA